MTMPQAPYGTPVSIPPPMPPPPSRRNLVTILATALAVAVAAIVVLLVLLLTSGDSDDGSSGTFTLSGTFSLTDGATDYTDVGECEGTGGYDDIREGTQVTVYGSGGEVLGTGSLGAST
jgi:hypothetical protein